MEKNLKTEITKSRIIKAATEEFALYGFDGAAVNQICQKHGISKGLIYHNFGGKEDLYLCCVEEAVNGFIAYMSGKDFGTDFKLYMKERYDFFSANPYYRQLIFADVLTDSAEFAKSLKEIRSRFDEFNKKVYLRAIDGIELRKGVSKNDASEYYSLLQNILNGCLNGGNASAESFDSAFIAHEKSLEKLLDFMLYGIAREETI
ncbi:MAG: TetR/AcrR family transcriptional regulator [Oscillospiraceae bacterium]|nr:TetR/AcrR family transcriptional regulator [Oscillospiraceae bacterium]